MRDMPLHPLHLSQGAALIEKSGWRLPLRFINFSEEYWAARREMALMDRSYLGRLELKGNDAKDLLDRLSTNKLTDLEDSQGRWTVLTTPKGRIIDRLLVTQSQGRLLVFTSPETPATVSEWLDRYTITEDVSTMDVGAILSMLCLMGPKSVATLSTLAGRDLPSLSPGHNLSISVDGMEPLVVRSDPAGVEGYDLIVPTEQVERLWRLLLALKAVAMGEEAYEALRIEAGIPRYGYELSEDYNPLEAGLVNDINFTKGCYVGQEVVARLNTYMKVQRFLMGLRLTGPLLPLPGTPLISEGRQVGRLTSTTPSPSQECILAMGYVHRDHAQPGTRVTLECGEGNRTEAELFSLPGAEHYAETLRPSNWEELAKLMEEE